MNMSRQDRIDWRCEGGRWVGRRHGQEVAEIIETAPGQVSAWVRPLESQGLRTADPAHPWLPSLQAADRACLVALAA